MSALTGFLIGSLIFTFLGSFLGAFLVYKFNPKDITYLIKKLRAKKGGVIDINQDIEQPEPEVKQKRKFFNLKHRRKNK
jgi:hypothetical protein